MPKITIEHKPSKERLDQLGVADWAIWEKEVSKFPIHIKSCKLLTLT